METLDLHGQKHKTVERIVETFVSTHGAPCRIITGNSVTMKKIVNEVLARFDLKSTPESDWNLGSLIVTDK